MTTLPDAGRTEVLRGTAATDMPTARLDVELRTSRYLLGARPDPRLADPALERAFEEVATQVRTAARAEGYAVGWAEGHRAATEQVRATTAEAARQRQAESEAWTESVRGTLSALARGATMLEERAVTPATELRDAVLHAAVELAEVLLGRELTLATEPGMDALRRALTLAPAGRPVTARLNPEDLPAARNALAALPEGELGRQVHLVPDPSVERAGCVVECDASRVDAQLSGALARVREVLGR
jgi:flagellar assembly protein FliH